MQLSSDLRYMSDKNLVWTRKKRGKGFQYLNSQGKDLSQADRQRVEKLVIPPAWKNVQISPDPYGHIQAIGYDSKDRKQYIYHSLWEEYQQQNKFDALLDFGNVLPTLRETMAAHMRQHKLSKERVLATVVWLLENTFIRIGHDSYAQQNQSYGLTTLRTRHVDVEGNNILFSFRGKSKVDHEIAINDRRVAQTIQQCLDLPGYVLFQYLDEDENKHQVEAGAVNDYLKEITGQKLSAKDFRTWGGTTLAGDTLYQLGSTNQQDDPEKLVVEAIKQVAEHLGNTPTVCRKYYVHPQIIEKHQKNKLVPIFAKVYQGFNADNHLLAREAATLQVLK